MIRKNYFLFLIVFILSIFLTELIRIFLNVDKLMFLYLFEKMNIEKVNEYMTLQENWKFLSFLILVFSILIKLIILSTCTFTVIYFSYNKIINFNQVLLKFIKAEFIFLLVPIFKIIWFYFFQINYTLEDIQYFYPLSALNIIGYNGLEPWLIYPLQIINLFELAYIIYLSYQIGKLTETNADNGLKIMMYSYVPTMLLWVCVVMFLTLSMS